MKSTNYLEWRVTLNPHICLSCLFLNGKIYYAYEPPVPAPPLHPNCKCELVPMRAKIAGTATKQWENGADWWLVYKGRLPDYYITKKEA